MILLNAPPVHPAQKGYPDHTNGSNVHMPDPNPNPNPGPDSYEMNNAELESARARAENAEARVAELEAKLVKWAPIISGRCGRCGLHDGHHTISCGIRK